MDIGKVCAMVNVSSTMKHRKRRRHKSDEDGSGKSSNRSKKMKKKRVNFEEEPPQAIVIEMPPPGIAESPPWLKQYRVSDFHLPELNGKTTISLFQPEAFAPKTTGREMPPAFTESPSTPRKSKVR
jgi:hypothetical protein